MWRAEDCPADPENRSKEPKTNKSHCVKVAVMAGTCPWPVSRASQAWWGGWADSHSVGTFCVPCRIQRKEERPQEERGRGGEAALLLRLMGLCTSPLTANPEPPPPRPPAEPELASWDSGMPAP